MVVFAERHDEPMIAPPDLVRVFYEMVNVRFLPTNEAGHLSNSLHMPLLSPNRRDSGLGLYPYLLDAAFIPARLFTGAVERRSTEHRGMEK